MGVLYTTPPTSSEETRVRAMALLNKEHHNTTELKNNIDMLVNMLSHTMLQLADAVEYIESLKELDLHTTQHPNP